jgi:hypothetical protein
MFIKFVVFSCLILNTFSTCTQAKSIWLKGEYHEEMSLASMYCAQVSGEQPISCNKRPKSWHKGIDLTNINIGTLSQEEIIKAVRFPDDPVKELSLTNPIGLIRWSWNMGIVGCKDKVNGLVQGLRCSSHYGPFQFLHAMSSHNGIQAKETKVKIMAWIEYLGLIIENKNNFMTSNYCEHWSTEKEKQNPIAKYMIPEGKDGFPCKLDSGPPWTIATPFAFHCKFKIITCDVDLNERNIKNNAIGALLHLIQDSYTQGHAIRGDCCSGKSKVDIAKYQCLPIKQFNSYQNQNKNKHADADGQPSPGTSCKNNHKQHDPITAGATILWKIKHENKNLSKSISKYLNANVFQLKTPKTLSSAGQGFQKI